MFQLSQTSYNRLKGIDQRLIDIVTMAIITSPIDFGIPQDGGLRTAERQNELFDLKKSRCDGYLKPSYHQSGKAFDIYAYVDKKASWNKEHLKTIANHLKHIALTEFSLKLEWGGDFKGFVDMPHFQIK